MRHLFKHLARYRKESVLAPLFKLLEAMMELYVPIVVADIIDRGIGAGNREYIISRFLVLLALAAAGVVFALTAQYFAAKAAVGCAGEIRMSLFDKVNRIAFADIDRIGTASLITRLSGDSDLVQNGINLFLRLVMRSPFVVLGAMIMAFTVNRKASVIFAAAIALLFAAAFAIMLVPVRTYRKVQNRADAMTGTVRENLIGVRVIRAYGMSENEREEFRSVNSALSMIQKTAGKISALMNPATVLILNCAVMVLLYVSGGLVDTGELTAGQTVALYNYMGQILVELLKLANLVITLSKASASMKRISEVLGTEPSMSFPEETKAAEDSQYAVEFRNVTLRYSEGAEPALSDISFRLRRGETLGIIGGTGSGKTSVLSLILRFYDATSGAVLVDGRDVKDYTAPDLRSAIGYALQKPVLFRGTMRSNLTYGNREAGDGLIMESVRTAQAENIVESRQEGLDSVIEQKGRNLSGGQRQRLTVARALARRPGILILDDSSSALDYATDAALRKSISELDYSPSVIIVSQRIVSVMNADTILVLDDGKTAGAGSHEELLKGCRVYREIYESQYGSAAGKGGDLLWAKDPGEEL
ncbi:MAG: ABC transporter ATP-binding protein [Clostridia bacterium]|nr:ABC transporter ATP-binding protein [Clostridia bacterium]